MAIHLRKRAITLFPYLDDWLVRNQDCLTLLRDRQVYPSIDHVLGTHNRSRKIGINPCSNICVHRDGIPYSGKHCQNSSRQSSKCSRISELVPETIISFSQSFPVPSGTTKCYCPVCDTRQFAFTSTSDGFVRTVETSCFTLTHKILISHQIKHHLKWWTNIDRFIQGVLSSQFRKRTLSLQTPVSWAGVPIWNLFPFWF